MPTKIPVYLDYNATTPILPEVLDAMLPFLTNEFWNPSSSHKYAAKAKAAIENARAQVADLLNCLPNEIVFTSGGTESNNIALLGLVNTKQVQRKHYITSSIEHPSIKNVCKYLEKNGTFRNLFTC